MFDQIGPKHDGVVLRKIIKINIPNNAFKKSLVSVFIIFKDEDAMKLGQEKHQEVSRYLGLSVTSLLNRR